MKKLDSPLSQDMAWAVACAAYRINGGYFKYIDHGKKPNTELIYEILQDQTGLLTDADREQGRVVREYIARTATMATLRGTLDSWGREMARVTQLDLVEDRFSFHVIASMPQTYARYLQREQVHQRLSDTVQAQDLSVNDKVELEVEVLETRWSQKWQTYYVTVIDTHNRSWMFAYRHNLAPGQRMVIRGTVKRFLKPMVQLKRVKIHS